MRKFILVILLIIAVYSAGLIYFSLALRAPAKEPKQVFFVIAPGQGIETISANLQRSGLIRNQLAFKAYLWLNHKKSKIQAGEYDLQTNLSVKSLVQLLASGQAISRERELKFIEGWTAEDMDRYLSETAMFKSGEFIAYAKNAQVDYAFLPVKTCEAGVNCPEPIKDLEGYLFPDTYRVFKTATVADVVNKMLKNFDQQLTPELRAEIQQQNRATREVVILASIIEKEVRSYEDKRLAADIFLKRLQINMSLQSDATVNYITKKKTTRPTFEDLAVDSRYNTYKHPGLPPGPICNPGLDSIKAAIYPEANDYYFFLTKEDGAVVWSQTGAEHEANKRQYLD